MIPIEIYIMGSAPEYTDNKVVRKKLFKAYLISFVFILLGIAVGVMSYLKVQADEVAAYEKRVRMETEVKLSKEIDLRKRREEELSQEREKRIHYEELSNDKELLIQKLTKELKETKEIKALLTSRGAELRDQVDVLTRENDFLKSK